MLPGSRTFNYIATVLTKRRNMIIHLGALFFLVAGFVYSLYLGNELRFPDESQYYKIAQNLAAGHGYSYNGTDPTAIRPPVYPLFLALFIKLGAPITILRYLNFIAMTLCVYLIRSILCYKADDASQQRRRQQSGAALSAILLAGYGVLFYTAGTLYPQTLYTLILLAIVRLAVVPNFGFLEAIWLGLLSALLILVHPTGVFIPPLVVVWLFWPRNYHIVVKGTVAALIAVACISIWSYRNYTAFNRFIPLTSHGADTLYLGNNPKTSLSAWYKYYEEDYRADGVYELTEAEENQYFLRKTLEFWTEHTGDAIHLYLIKLLDYFNFRNNLYVSSESSFFRDMIMFITYYPLLVCLVVRLFTLRRVPLSRLEALFVAIYIVSAFFHAIFLPRIRFRLPYDAVLIAYIGILFSMFLEHHKGVEPTRMVR